MDLETRAAEQAGDLTRSFAQESLLEIIMTKSLGGIRGSQEKDNFSCVR